MGEQERTPRLSMATKIAWGFTDAGVNIFVYLKAVVILAFMTQYMGVAVSLAGLVTGLVVLTDMVTDPLIGSWSDRTATRFGRRRPFMIVGMIVMFVFTYLMFNPPGLSGLAAALWVFVFYALASIGFTMVAVPYGAMATEMTRSPQERTNMMGFRFAFASVGLLLAGLLATPAAIASGSALTWIIIALLMIVPVSVCVMATSRAPRVTKATYVPLAEQFSLVRAHPSFIRHVIAYGIMTVGVAILSGGILFITTDVSIRHAQSGTYDDYFTTDFTFVIGTDADTGAVVQNVSLMERLGLIQPVDGWLDRDGNPVDPAQVQSIDPRQPDWFNQVDIAALQDSPYGRVQSGAIRSVLNRAIQNRVAGPAAIIVGLAGFFGAVFALFLLGSIVSQLFWVPISGVLGRGRALVLGLVAYGVLACLYLFVLKSQNPTFIIYGAFLLGFCNGSYQNLPWAILPSMIDEANANAKVNVEGVFNGLWLSGQKVANSVGPWLFALLIGWFGYQSSTIGFGDQTASASAALEVFMTVLPGIFFLLAIPLFLTVRADLRR